MPRFGSKALFVGFTVAAVWLSTFAGYRAAADVRKSILLLILVTSGLVAVYSRGRRRAFWTAYFVVMLLCGGLSYDRLLYRYTPDFNWLELSGTLDQNPPLTPPTPAARPQSPIGAGVPPAVSPYLIPAPTVPAPVLNYQAIDPDYVTFGNTTNDARIATIEAAWTIGLAFLAAFVAAYIYTQLANSSRKSC